jgi:hypothetical protein
LSPRHSEKKTESQDGMRDDLHAGCASRSRF